MVRGYEYTELDEKNLGWFSKDPTRATLLGIRLTKGSFRGLENIEIEFSYPISAIAGCNGSGKSTILGLAACGFHNSPEGFKLPTRDHPWYTFGDFFVQSSEEKQPDGIEVEHQILYNDWVRDKETPDGIGACWQSQAKTEGGRWTNYRSRVDRNVIFLGVERVVPHVERSTSRTYSKAFKEGKEATWEKEVRESVGRVLDRSYDRLRYKEHSYYRLPVVKCGDSVYSGFNMGAGENTLFDIFSWIYECPEGVLLVIDELELGLHEQAQIRLIMELKRVCLARKAQIICTTHSPTVLAHLPPEARFFVERNGPKTRILKGITPAYAAGLMSGIANPELLVLVEDDAARSLVDAAATRECRQRIQILEVGSAASVVRHLATRYKEGKGYGTIAILDGDQRKYTKTHLKTFCDALETPIDGTNDEKYAEASIRFLPGETWPEKWALDRETAAFADIARDAQMDLDQFAAALGKARNAKKHSEYWTLANELVWDRAVVRARVSACAMKDAAKDAEYLRDQIEERLAGA